MDKTEAKSVMVERYPDPSVEDPQLYQKLLTLPGDQVSWKKSCILGLGYAHSDGNVYGDGFDDW